jgi:hypothetical protein
MSAEFKGELRNLYLAFREGNLESVLSYFDDAAVFTSHAPVANWACTFVIIAAIAGLPICRFSINRESYFLRMVSSLSRVPDPVVCPGAYPEAPVVPFTEPFCCI